MKLLIWSQYFWPENFRINDLVRNLVQWGNSITVLTGKPNYPDGHIFEGYRIRGLVQESFAGSRVLRIPILPRGRASRLGLVLNYLSFVLSGYLLAPLILRRQHFDVVFVYAPSPLFQALPALMVAWIKRSPIVIWVQDLWPEVLLGTGYVRNPIVLRAVKAVVRYIYRHADLILVQSEAFRSSVERLVQDKDKIHYFPNSADLPDGGHVGSETACRLAKDMRQCFAVVFAGNLGSAQSLETILEAAERLKAEADTKFYIVGTGSRVGWMAEEVCCRGLSNVVLAGHFHGGDMPTILDAASALLVTLKDDPVGNFTIPSKVQAYLAAGRPIVAAVNGEGARIIAEANAGVTSPAENGEALAGAVMRLKLMPEGERNLFGKNGRNYFLQHFESSRLTDQLMVHLKMCRENKRSGKR